MFVISHLYQPLSALVILAVLWIPTVCATLPSPVKLKTAPWFPDWLKNKDAWVSSPAFREHERVLICTLSVVPRGEYKAANLNSSVIYS